MTRRFRVVDFKKTGSGTRYQILDTENNDSPSEHDVFDVKSKAEEACSALNAKEHEPWNDPEHKRLTGLNAGHLVAALIIMNNKRPTKPSVMKKAQDFFASAEKNLEDLGYLPKQSFPIEHALGTPDFLIQMGGNDVAIPHKNGEFQWRVNSGYYMEVFNACYPDPWL